MYNNLWHGCHHSFGSYGYYYLGAERTIDLMGHVGGYGLFSRHYKNNASEWTARLWFSIQPPKAE